MAEPSKKRQERLRLDADVVMGIYQHACKRWGKDAVDADLTRIWDMRCILGTPRRGSLSILRAQVRATQANRRIGRATGG